MKRLLSLLSLVCLFVVGTYATARIFAYDLSLTTEGTNYTFSFKANETPTSASIVFYNSTTGEYIDEVAIDSPTSGSNSKTIEQEDLPGGGTMTWGIKLHGANITTLQTVHTDNVTAYKRGFAVINTNPESDFFGRIYGIGTKVTPNFIQDYLPDYTISTKTNYFSPSSGIGNPQRSCVAKDGTLYIADYGDAHPGVFTMNPSTHALNAIFVGEGLSTASSGLITTSSSVKVASSSPACYVYGEGKDTKLYMVQEDFGTANTSAAHPVTMYQLGQEDGSVHTTWAAAPTRTYTISGHDGGNSQIIANDKGFWLCQYRSTNTEAVPSLMFYNSDGTRTFSSGATAALRTAIPSNYRGAFAISQDGTKLAININGTKFSLFDIEWSGSTPSLTNQTDITHSFGQMGQMAFDYAGNLIAIAGTYDTSMKLYVFATPTDNNECTVPAKKALTVYKPIANPVASVSLDPTSKTVKVGDTFTLTPTVLPADATDKTYSWSTTNAGVATIADGVVTAVGVGSADITVTTTDGSKTATCAVTVEAPDPLAGSYKIGGAEADFATLYNAVNYLNNWGISGNTTFLICGNLTETHNIGLVNTSAYTITIKPDADADRTISFTQVADNDGPSGAIVIGVNSEGIGWAGTATQNIVFDGLASAEATHKMTIKNASTFGSTYGPFVIYGAVTNTAIRNCRIISEVSPTCYCITFRNNQPTGSSSKSDDYADGVIIENNYIATPSNAGNGQAIYINGSKATTTGPSNLVIRNNEIVANSRGITLYGLNNIDISNNIIRMNSASGYDCAAIYGLTSSGNINICNNQILSLASGNESTTTAHGLQGIIAGSGGNWLIANNLITGFDAKTDGRKGHLIGIKTGGTPSSIKILHNTLYMPAFNHTMTSALLNAKPVTLLYIAGGSPIVKNNILISEETSCVNSLIRGELNANCTNNVLYSAGGSGVIVDGATACANWDEFCTKYSAQARTSTWQQIELEDNYKPTSTYIDNVNLAVTPLAEVTTDIEGTTRNETKTYAGCYEASNIAAVYSGVSSLTLPATASVERDNTLELTPTVTPTIAANRTQFWSSDNTAVATVDNSGVVTAVAVGTAHITVTIDGVTSDACTVTVYRTDFEVTWEPNGATTTSTAPASNEELWEAFKPAYNTFYSASRSTTIAITAVATFANAKMQEFMTDPASSWKWLGDYMLSVATAQGYNFEPETNVTAEQKWRFCAQAFFNCAEANVYAINAPDFTTAGQIANWLPLWKQANNYLPATMRSTDEMPVIRKGNDYFAGWYDNSSFTGSPVTSVTEDITLYAKWIAPVVLDETTDNTSTLSDNDGKTGNVILKRPFTSTEHWYTLVLPFDVTAAQLEEAFGAGTEVAVLQETYWKNDAHTDLFLRFAPQANINAGEPCLFKPAQVIDEQVVFHGVTIDNQTPSLTSDVVDMIGMYSPTDVTVNEVNYYLGNTNLLHLYVDAYKNTKGFRAYFHFDSPLPAHASARVIFHKDVVTDIEDLQSVDAPAVQKVIRDGQLIIIRDGKEFNAQGQLVR